MLSVSVLSVRRFILSIALFGSFVVLSACGSSGDDDPGIEPPGDEPVVVAEGDILTATTNCSNSGVQLDRRFSAPFDVDTIKAIENDYRKEVDSDKQNQVRFITDRGLVGEKPDMSSWTTVFDEPFDVPSSQEFVDLSGSLDWRRWNTKCAFSTSLEPISIAGEESFCNINTTGRYPGEGPTLANFDNEIGHIEFLDQLFDSSQWIIDGSSWRPEGDTDPAFPVFRLNSDAMSGGSALNITAHRGVGPAPGSTESRPYVSGLISSHSNPDPAKELTVAAHGFEFRYGYAEARIRLPAQGNGIRTAFWLYSDNAYMNAIVGENTNRHEIDIMEFLPNSEADTNCYTPQPLLFAGTMDNTQRAADRQFMTYDTVFNTYHHTNLTLRSPTDWTFNSSDRYRTRRNQAFNIADTPPFGFTLDENAPGEEGWIRFGVLWEADKIEWYINDVLIHRVIEVGEEIPGVQHVAPVFDQRMYMIANLAMGLDGFEGEVDDTIYNSLEDGGAGPSLEIDYIKVMQNPSNLEHVHCGLGYQRCDTLIGMTP